LLAIQLTNQIGPLITEYIVPFDLPIDDLKATAANQISRNQFKTNTFTTDNVTVSKLIFKTTYNGSNKIVDPKSFIYNIDNNRHSTLYGMTASIL
jgi:hypothetical protein